jgi:group I intron endonuclease
MSGIIYKATNKINGKVYIGRTTKDIHTRKSNHKTLALSKNSSNRFHKAIREYGFNSFVWEVIDTADNENELKEKEGYWIQKLNATVDGYNSAVEGTKLVRKHFPFPDPMLKQIEAYQKTKGIKFTSAVLELVRLGLETAKQKKSGGCTS